MNGIDAILANVISWFLARTNHEEAGCRKRQFRLDESDWTASRPLGNDQLLDHVDPRLGGAWVADVWSNLGRVVRLSGRVEARACGMGWQGVGWHAHGNDPESSGKLTN